MDEERVKKLVRELIIEVGEDPTREGLRETPKRIASMYKEIFAGYDSDSELSVQFSEDSDVVIARDIQFYSMCEHHMLPFYGKIHIAYSPNGVKGVAVFADAEHLCMKMRGVRNDATLSSSAFRGIYENKEEKESVLALIRKRSSDSSF